MFDDVDDDEAIAVVHAAYDAGIRLFDTAPLYGHGLSERRLGAALATLPRDEITVATKVGRVLVPDEPNHRDHTIFVDVPSVHPVFDFSADGTRRSLAASLERLGLDRVDIVHVHDPDDHADEALAGAFPVLRQWRDEGVVGRIGSGMNQSALLTRFVREADVDCVLLAGRYTLLDQSALDDLLPLCKETGVAVFAAGVFNSGVLADPRPGAHFDYAPAAAALIERARELAAICARYDVPLTAAALQFPARHPAVECVLTGVRSVAELEANVADAAISIPDALWDELVNPRR
jgi:D-threo-aldose 1-dehydrogenase